MSPACYHRVLEGNIHEFGFTEVSRRAVDELFDILNEIEIDAARGDPRNHYNPALIDSSIGLQPLNYAFIRLRPMLSQYPLMRRARVAMIVPHSPLLKTLGMVMRSIAPFRLYYANQRDEAVAWLRESEDFIPSP